MYFETAPVTTVTVVTTATGVALRRYCHYLVGRDSACLDRKYLFGMIALRRERRRSSAGFRGIFPSNNRNGRNKRDNRGLRNRHNRRNRRTSMAIISPSSFSSFLAARASCAMCRSLNLPKSPSERQNLGGTKHDDTSHVDEIAVRATPLKQS